MSNKTQPIPAVEASMVIEKQAPIDLPKNRELAPVAQPTLDIQTVTQWLIAANSNDPSERDAANNALIKSPREKLLPLLQNLVGNGDFDNRQAALNTLHMLAVKQGDDEGEIQNILRLTSYDGDDALASNAQLALEDIEGHGDRMLLINP